MKQAKQMKWLAVAETNPAGVPIRRVYRKYFRWRWTALIWGSFFVCFYDYGAVDIFSRK